MKDITLELRMLFFIRTDLKMSKGKIAAQVGHGVQYLIEKHIPEHNKTYVYRQWSEDISTKICLKITSEEEFNYFYNLGLQSGFPTVKVIDKGITCFDGQETPTVVGWGPITKSAHQELTAHLKLL